MSIYISSALVLNQSLTSQPLTHARIGYQSVITLTGLTGTEGESGYPLSNVINPATFERYKPTTPSTCTLNIDAGGSVPVDYVGIQARGVTSVLVYSSLDGVTYTLAAEFNPTGAAIMALFEEVTAQYYRVVLNGSGIAVIALKVGKALAMQRAIYSGHTPITLAPVNAVRPNMSETGQFLGASIQRKGMSTSFSWDNLKEDWYRANFDLFVQSQPRVQPFFIAWRPESYPNEVAYCWASSDPQPSNSGTKDFMSVGLSVEGFSDVV